MNWEHPNIWVKLARNLTRPISDFTQKVAFWKGNGTPCFREVKYYNLARNSLFFFWGGVEFE